jgi:hypothetical protein
VYDGTTTVYDGQDVSWGIVGTNSVQEDWLTSTVCLEEKLTPHRMYGAHTLPNPCWVSLRCDQLIASNKVVDKKDELEKGLEEEVIVVVSYYVVI